MKTGKKFRWTALLAGILLLAGIMGYQMASGAVFDESRAVKYRDYAASHTIEDSVLFVGTYLIHTQALTDELYEKAQKSVEDSGQMQVYYKSELAGGAWFDVTDASELKEITTEGTVITEDELAELWVTHYTGSDGITKSAVDDQTVNIFDTPDPYDLYNLPELEPIKIQYDNVFSEDSVGVDKYYYEKLKEFFELEVKNDITDECDEQLSELQTCYERLQAEEKKELAEIVSKLMSRVDARRRAEVFSRLSQIDENELELLQRVCTGSGYSEGDYDGKQFVENNSVIDAIGTSIQNCQESYITHSSNQLEQGTTVLKNVEYDKSMEVIDSASGNVEPLLEQLTHIYHIQEDVVADADAELTILEQTLIPAGESKYRQKLSEGANSDYQAAVANNISLAAKNQVLEEQKADVNAARMELQYLIEAKTKRQDAASACAYLYERIDGLGSLRGAVASDAFRDKALETVDEHELWLQEQAGKLSGENENLMSEMQKLENEKQEILEKQAEALDQNDLSLARKYETMAVEVDKKIEEKEKELLAVLTNPGSSAAEKAQAANQSGSSTALSNINQLKNAALSAIAAGDQNGMDSLNSSLDALVALGAESVLSELKDKVKDSGNSDVIKAIEQAIEESKDSSLHGLYGNTGGTGGGGTGTGSGTGGGGTGTGSGTGGSGTGTGSGTGGSNTGMGSGTGTGSGAGGSGTGTGGQAGTNGTGTDVAILGNINQMKSDALSLIENGSEEEMDAVNGILDALASLGAEPALSEIRDQLRNSGNSDALAAAEKALEKSRNSKLHESFGGGTEGGASDTGSGTGGGSGMGSGTGTDAGGQSGKSVILSNRNQLKKEASAMIAEGDPERMDTLEGILDALAALGAESELSELKDKAEDTGNDDALAAAQKAIEESKKSSLHDLTGSGEGDKEDGSVGATLSGSTGSNADGTENLQAAAITSADIEDAVNAVYGKDFNDLGAAEKAVVTAAANRLGLAGSRDGANLARAYAERLAEEGNPYLYRKLEGQSERYVSIKTLGYSAGYRYVYSDSKREATLTKKSKVYKFRMSWKEAELSDGSKKELKRSVRMQKLLYLSEVDAINLFECFAEYIQASDYAICLNGTLDKKAAEFCRTFEGGGV